MVGRGIKVKVAVVGKERLKPELAVEVELCAGG